MEGEGGGMQNGEIGVRDDRPTQILTRKKI